jgi:hypothetical protein
LSAFIFQASWARHAHEKNRKRRKKIFSDHIASITQTNVLNNKMFNFECFRQRYGKRHRSSIKIILFGNQKRVKLV